MTHSTSPSTGADRPRVACSGHGTGSSSKHDDNVRLFDHVLLVSPPRSPASMARRKLSTWDEPSIVPPSTRHNRESLTLDQAKEDAQKELIPVLQRYQSKIPRRQHTTLRATGKPKGTTMDSVLQSISEPPKTFRIDATSCASFVASGQNDSGPSDPGLPRADYDPSEGDATVSEPERDDDDVSSDGVLKENDKAPPTYPCRFSPSRPVFLFRPLPLTPDGHVFPSPRQSHDTTLTDALEQTARQLLPPSIGQRRCYPLRIPTRLSLPEDCDEFLWVRGLLSRLLVMTLAFAVGVFGLYCEARVVDLHDAMLPALGQFEANVNRVLSDVRAWHQPLDAFDHQLRQLDAAFHSELSALHRAADAIVDDQVLSVVALWDLHESTLTFSKNQSRQASAAMASEWSADAVSVDAARLSILQQELVAVQEELAQLRSCLVVDTWMEWIAPDEDEDGVDRWVAGSRPQSADVVDDRSWLYIWCVAVIGGALAGVAALWMTF